MFTAEMEERIQEQGVGGDTQPLAGSQVPLKSILTSVMAVPRATTRGNPSMVPLERREKP